MTDAYSKEMVNDICSQGTVNIDNSDRESQAMLMIGNKSRRVNVFHVNYVQKNKRFDNLENSDASDF